jgi:predicted nucleic acid-binding protein
VRVFLDANILFSAAKSAGAVRELLARAEGKGHRLCADAYVAAEAQRNLQGKAPEGLAVLAAILSRIEVAGYDAGPVGRDIEAVLPEKDRPVLAAAVRLRCDALVTGDRTHFGPLYGRKVMGVAVHSPRSLAEALGLL